MIIQTGLILENMQCRETPDFLEPIQPPGQKVVRQNDRPLLSSFLFCQFEIFQALTSLSNLYTQ